VQYSCHRSGGPQTGWTTDPFTGGAAVGGDLGDVLDVEQPTEILLLRLHAGTAGAARGTGRGWFFLGRNLWVGPPTRSVLPFVGGLRRRRRDRRGVDLVHARVIHPTPRRRAPDHIAVG
jgi:hypothetical protein